MEPSRSSQSGSFYSMLAISSMAMGLVAIISCFSPPVQLGFGACALILAYASRLKQPLTIPAVIGIVLGVISIITSVIMCVTVLYGIRMMDDPANAAFMREFLKEYQNALESLNTK